jgi:hypothetical protein
MSQWLQIRPVIDEMVNRQFDTAEFKALCRAVDSGRQSLSEPHDLYAANRRDCWSFVAGKAPLDVKRAIWEHEKDELIHDTRMGRARVTEDDLQAGDESCSPLAQKRLSTRGSIARVRNRGSKGWFIPIFPRGGNNNAIVKGGGLVGAEACSRAELGTQEAEKDFQTEVHAVADEDHSDIFEPIFARHVDSEAAAQAVLAATRDGLVIDRALRGAMADAMAAVE